MTSVVALTEILNVTVTPAPGSVQDTNLTEVAGNAVPTGVGASDAGTQRVALSTDSTVAISNLPVTPSTPITGTLSANGVLVSIDTNGYSSVSVQLTGTWVAEVTFQMSNDNVNFVNVQGYAFNSTMSAVDKAVNNDIFVFPVTGRYFQAVVSNFVEGTVTATAYVKTQSLAGYGEAALTQAMDAGTGTPMNVTYAGVQGAGQQPAANSVPVALANEQVLDKWIVGKQYIGSILVNTNLALDVASVGNSPAQPLDCLQYRSIGIQIFQSGSVNSGALAFEASNDGLTWVTYPLYTASANAFGTQTTTSTFSTTAGTTIIYEGPIYLRYFRIRVSTAVSTTTTQIQMWTRLSMAPYTKYNQSGVNIAQLGTATVPGGTTQTSSSSYGANGAFMPFGGIDKSITRSEFLGAPSALLTTQYTAGPYSRIGYTDLAGNMGVAGPQPFLAEDKTYPVNVRLERTTNGQDSVQDLLQQVLVELKALNYYTREMPTAIATLNQTPNPLNSFPASMRNDPENFADDQTLSRYQKGH